MTPSFLKLNPYNFVPITRTPWGGPLIVKTKRQILQGPQDGWPERVGESWEVSTDKAFPSVIKKTSIESHVGASFEDVLKENPQHFLGSQMAAQFGSHCPLLLKWISAADPLSVQVHPQHNHPALTATECGKPESWLVLDTESNGYVYLGFKENLTQDEITEALTSDRAGDVLHKVFPSIGDYISIPTGCVHATGPGVLIAEPQFVLPGRSGKTWRLSDWGRRYDSQGQLDPHGQPRELHIENGLTAIDWSLPRGPELEKVLIRRLQHCEVSPSHAHNPFPAQVFSKAGMYTYKPLVHDQFSLVTCWSGQLQLISSDRQHLVLNAGESGLIAAGAGSIEVALARQNPDIEPSGAFFAFADPEVKGL
jgi:mannose-6-phosphate isomerase